MEKKEMKNCKKCEFINFVPMAQYEGPTTYYYACIKDWEPGHIKQAVILDCGIKSKDTRKYIKPPNWCPINNPNIKKEKTVLYTEATKNYTPMGIDDCITPLPEGGIAYYYNPETPVKPRQKRKF